MQVFALLLLAVGSLAAQDGYNLDMINNFINNDPASLCSYVQCQEPITKANCPEGSRYLEGAAQFGCCGACVQFQQVNQTCTGSLDPLYGGGYSGTFDTRATATTPELRASFYPLPPAQNVLKSAWCDYKLNCSIDQICEFGSDYRGCLFVQSQYDLETQDPDIYVPYRDNYRWRPVCTEKGEYAPVQCKGQGDLRRCVCVDPEGNRLFGDVFKITTDLFNSINCKCSRRDWEKKAAGETIVTLHCDPLGNYEPLQCEDHWCYCMDPVTATPIGPRVPETAISRLSCYNATLVGEQYLRRCDSQLEAHWELYDVMNNRGLAGNSYPLTNCSLDGSYSGMQCDQSRCSCVDQYNQYIEIGGSGCKCARDRLYFEQSNIQFSVQCDFESGSYAEIQQPIGADYRYCVDQDGVRAGPKVFTGIGTLDCDKAAMCQAGLGGCEDVCKGCTDTAYPDFSVTV